MLATSDLGDPSLPPVLLVPSVGSNLAPWRRVFHRLLDTHRVITWDLRGLHDVGVAADGPDRSGRPRGGCRRGARRRGPRRRGPRHRMEHRGPDRPASSPLPIPIAWSPLALVNGMNGYPISRLSGTSTCPWLSRCWPASASTSRHSSAGLLEGDRSTARARRDRPAGRASSRPPRISGRSWTCSRDWRSATPGRCSRTYEAIAGAERPRGPRVASGARPYSIVGDRIRSRPEDSPSR